MRHEKKMASALGETPVTLPGNNITGDVTVVFTALTTASSSNWSTAVDPPTRIAFAPHFSALEATLAASAGGMFSESSNPTQTVPCFFMRSLSLDSICLSCCNAA